MTRALTIWKAGLVSRWHTNPHHGLRNSGDINHAHSARVAQLWRCLDPEFGGDDALAALDHDLWESVIGDMSGETKRANPDFARVLAAHEAALHMEHGTCGDITPRQATWLKLCDKLDAVLWAISIDPGLMDREDWIAQIEDVLSRSLDLGVYHVVEAAIRGAMDK